MIRTLSIILLLFTTLQAMPQQFSGMTGLISVPSAEMDTVGEARIGTHFINRHSTPDYNSWSYRGKKYDTYDFYMSLTPFWWVEIGFTFTLFRHEATSDNPRDKSGYTRKDRYFSIKFNPLRESRYIPALAIGATDFFSSGGLFEWRTSDGNNFWRNYYIAATKHFNIKKELIGVTVAYRHFTSSYNHRWNGITGGITYNPSFFPQLRGMLEWNGCDMNLGADVTLWKHLLIQFSLQGFRYPSAGLCYKINLF